MHFGFCLNCIFLNINICFTLVNPRYLIKNRNLPNTTKFLKDKKLIFEKFHFNNLFENEIEGNPEKIYSRLSDKSTQKIIFWPMVLTET